MTPSNALISSVQVSDADQSCTDERDHLVYEDEFIIKSFRDSKPSYQADQAHVTLRPHQTQIPSTLLSADYKPFA
jgi:hypothetical protein